MARQAQDSLIVEPKEELKQFNLEESSSEIPITPEEGVGLLPAGNILSTSKTIIVGTSASRTEIDPNKGIQTPSLSVVSHGEKVLEINSEGDLTARNAQIAGDIAISGILRVASYLVASLPALTVAGTAADDSTVGTLTWSTPNEAKTPGGGAAFVTDTSGNPVQSHYLKLTNFGLSIPSDRTILGIEVEIDRNAAVTGDCKDTVVKLVKADGTLGTENKADTATNWPSSTGQIATYGSPTDLWSNGWAPADVNNSNFGVVLSITFDNTGGFNPSVWCLRLNVYYSGSNAPAKQGAAAFAINGRKNGEGAGLGSGVMVFHDGRFWRACDTGATVAA